MEPTVEQAEGGAGLAPALSPAQAGTARRYPLGSGQHPEKVTKAVRSKELRFSMANLSAVIGVLAGSPGDR